MFWIATLLLNFAIRLSRSGYFPAAPPMYMLVCFPVAVLLPLPAPPAIVLLLETQRWHLLISTNLLLDRVTNISSFVSWVTLWACYSGSSSWQVEFLRAIKTRGVTSLDRYLIVSVWALRWPSTVQPILVRLTLRLKMIMVQSTDRALSLVQTICDNAHGFKFVHLLRLRSHYTTVLKERLLWHISLDASFSSPVSIRGLIPL